MKLRLGSGNSRGKGRGSERKRLELTDKKKSDDIVGHVPQTAGSSSEGGGDALWLVLDVGEQQRRTGRGRCRPLAGAKSEKTAMTTTRSGNDLIGR